MPRVVHDLEQLAASIPAPREDVARPPSNDPARLRRRAEAGACGRVGGCVGGRLSS